MSCSSSTAPSPWRRPASAGFSSPNPSTPMSPRGGPPAMGWATSTASPTRSSTWSPPSRRAPTRRRRSPTGCRSSGCSTPSSAAPPTAPPGPRSRHDPRTRIIARRHLMPRPVTLFTGQWADLPFEEVCKLASGWGYDGLEIACWGDHFDPWAAVEDDSYVPAKKELVSKYDLQVFAISNHLKGQAVCDDPIDERHRGILPDRIWGDGDAEGVRRRAADEMKMTARAARKLGVDVVVGFTGSSIWKYVAMFPPASQELVDAGYEDFATRWNPILDVFDGEGVRFAHEVHPSEIAYDYWTTVRAMEAVGHREAFGLNWDPSHFVWQDLDPVGFLWDFRERIYHVDCKDTKLQVGNGRNGRLGSHLPWADPRRGWDFVSTGHGDVPWERCFRMLNTIGYAGPISVEWEDAGMDRLVGAPEALEFVRRLAFDPPAAAFDAAF